MAGDPLVISVGADVGTLERAMRQAAAASDRAAAEIEKRFDRIDLVGSFGLGALQGAIAAISLDRLIRAFADANSEVAGLGDTAKRTGLDLERLQELRLAAQGQGIDGKQFDSGLDSLGKNLNDARTQENDLTKLLDINNIKYKDREGNVIGINAALLISADLIKNAATEFDKIEIAKAVGLTKEWVPLLEGGAAGLERAASAARQAGGIIGSDIVEKAKDFEDRWNSAVASWAALFKSNIGGIIDLINGMIGLAGRLTGSVSRYSAGLQAKSDLEANGAEGANRDTLKYVQGEFNRTGEDLPEQIRKRVDILNEVDRELARASARTGKQPLEVTVNGSPTKRPVKESGGGGSSGKTDEEKRYDEVERYLAQLEKVSRVLEAERATLGLSSAERAKAIELAKIGTITDDDQRKKLGEVVEKNEQLREAITRVKEAQKALNDAAKFFGDVAVDALSDFILNGAKAEDVAKNLANAIAKAAIQAAVLGDGPLAGALGTKGANGSAGGLVGGLTSIVKGIFGFASGGYTGAGARDEPAGIVHRGEYVFDKAATSRIGLANLERLRRGYANGGPVGPSLSLPAIPTARPAAGGGGGVKIVVNNNANAQVQQRQRQTAGGTEIDIMIDEISAQKIGQPGSRSRSAMRSSFGLTNPLAQR